MPIGGHQPYCAAIVNHTDDELHIDESRCACDTGNYGWAAVQSASDAAYRTAIDDCGDLEQAHHCAVDAIREAWAERSPAPAAPGGTTGTANIAEFLDRRAASDLESHQSLRPDERLSALGSYRQGRYEALFEAANELRKCDLPPAARFPSEEESRGQLLEWLDVFTRYIDGVESFEYCTFCEKHAPKNDGAVIGPIEHRESCDLIRAKATAISGHIMGKPAAFPSEEECVRAFNDAYATDETEGVILAGIRAVRSLCLAGLEAGAGSEMQ